MLSSAEDRVVEDGDADGLVSSAIGDTDGLISSAEGLGSAEGLNFVADTDTVAVAVAVAVRDGDGFGVG